MAPQDRKQQGRTSRRNKIAKAHERLLKQLASSVEARSTRHRVGFILSLFPQTRDSDVALCIQYWKLFYPEIVDDEERVELVDLYQLERATSIVRARQKIQNEFRLFPASPTVQHRRKELAGKQREAQLEDKPEDPLIQVICDESGKSDRYAIVGSVWVNDEKRYFEVVKKLMSWKIDKRIAHEFHFTRLRKQDVGAALEFMQQALSEADAICFKAVLVESAGIRGTREELFLRLHAELCVRGLEHEQSHRRIELPRTVHVVKDSDYGSDKLYISELERRLKADLPSSFDNRARVGSVVAEESRCHVLIQVADLFTGSLNRVLNQRTDGKVRNHKDEFADQLLTSLGLDPDDATALVDQDLVMVRTL